MNIVCRQGSFFFFFQIYLKTHDCMHETHLFLSVYWVSLAYLGVFGFSAFQIENSHFVSVFFPCKSNCRLNSIIPVELMKRKHKTLLNFFSFKTLNLRSVHKSVYQNFQPNHHAFVLCIITLVFLAVWNSEKKLFQKHSSVDRLYVITVPMVHCNLWRIWIETNWNRCEHAKESFQLYVNLPLHIWRMQYILIFFICGTFSSFFNKTIEKSKESERYMGGERMKNWKIIITLHYVFYLNFDSVDRRMPRARKIFRTEWKKKNGKWKENGMEIVYPFE